MLTTGVPTLLMTIRHHHVSGRSYRDPTVPYRIEAEAVIVMWREVKRRLDALPPDSDEGVPLIEEWARLRTEHLRLIDLARKHHRPEPPPWPISNEADEDERAAILGRHGRPGGSG